MLRPTRKIVFTAIFAGAWIAALACGLGALARYENRAGTVGATPDSWPATSHIARTQNHYTLVMLAHPRCPCTHASVEELSRIMAHVHGNVDAYVLFLKPGKSDADWDDTGLRRNTARIPGVTVLTDVDGEEARGFGAETSGYTLLFDANGHRVFSGGITASRGHEGDNVGESAIVSLVYNRPALRSTSVFGCSLSSRVATKGTPCPGPDRALTR